MSKKVVSILEFRNRTNELSSLSNQIKFYLQQLEDTAVAIAEIALKERTITALSSSYKNACIGQRILKLEQRVQFIVSKLMAAESAMQQSSAPHDEPCY